MSARLALPALLLTAALVACGGDDDSGEPGSTGDQPGATTGEDGTTSDGPGEPATTGDGPTTGEPATTSTSTTTTSDPTTSTSTTTTATTGDPSAGESSDTGVLEELPPIESTEILEAWLAGGSYKTWAAESGVHPSTGPHGGNVRTFVNAVALASLAADAPEHPQDAATVKELYGDGVDEIIGYAVSLKTAPESQGGNTWYWYERINATTYGGELGTGLCTGCHGGGADYILTPFPLQ